MRIGYFADYLTHHNKPICDEFRKILGKDFKFIACSPTPRFRLDLGFSDMNNDCEYVIKAYESKELWNDAFKIAENYDAIIHGSADIEFSNIRIKYNKPLFIFSERIFKKGLKFFFEHPRTVIGYTRRNRVLSKNARIYLLCCSAFAPIDYKLLLWNKRRMYRWGYFTEAIEYNIEDLMQRKSKDIVKLFWAGRFIDWKHPELPIIAASYLKDKRYSFKLTMAGDGPLLNEMKKLAYNYGLENEVTFLGAIPFNQVRSIMEESNIYLFTSDRNEGWGAVLNEAMNSGCAVVAGSSIGAVPFLINNEKNGLIYCAGDTNDFNNCVERIFADKAMQRYLGLNAYRTITELWNPKIAAERFLTMVQHLEDKQECNIFDDGPGSRPEILKTNWYRSNSFRSEDNL